MKKEFLIIELMKHSICFDADVGFNNELAMALND